MNDVFLRQCAELAQYGKDQFEMWFDGGLLYAVVGGPIGILVVVGQVPGGIVALGSCQWRGFYYCNCGS